MGGWDAPWHWVILAIIVIALFGYKKLPDAARSLGRSMRIFKTEIKGMSEDDKKRAEAGGDPAQSAQPAQSTQSVQPRAVEGAASQPVHSAPQQPSDHAHANGGVPQARPAHEQVPSVPQAPAPSAQSPQTPSSPPADNPSA